MLKISKTIKTDLLIIGAGIAGLSACVEANRHNIPHVLITKNRLAGGASFFPLKATLGIQVTGENDTENFREEIERVSHGINNPKIIQAYIEDSPQAIELLNRIGFRAWKRSDNRLACFAKYARPIYLINDWQTAAKRAKKIILQQQTQLFKNATLLHIATDHHQVVGAVFSVETSGQISYIFCQTKQIILATGGIAGLYQNNLYPADVIGSTHYLAQQAGAKVVNLAYIQFIHAFVEPKYKVLFGEHMLKYVTDVLDKNGASLFSQMSQTEFQQMMVERSGYAPFSVDFACYQFDLVTMKYLLNNPDAKGFYLKFSAELYANQEEFYRVYLNWLEQEIGLHLLKDKIAIAPFAHSCNGGIEINEWGETTVQGLFAIGEVACSVEGANRLGGNSVGAALVFAKRAISYISQHLQKNGKIQPLVDYVQIAEQQLNALAKPNATLTGSQVLQQVRALMTKYANIYRTEANLQHLLRKLEELEQNFNPLAELEIYFALQTAQLVAQQMLSEKESKGGHYLAKEKA